MLISFVMLIFLLFKGQILGGGAKVSEGQQTACSPPPVKESQNTAKALSYRPISQRKNLVCNGGISRF